jgi:hypothetical protein
MNVMDVGVLLLSAAMQVAPLSPADADAGAERADRSMVS